MLPDRNDLTGDLFFVLLVAVMVVAVLFIKKRPGRAEIAVGVGILANFDRKHLIDPPEVSKKSGLSIGTAGTILNQIRNTID